MILGGIQAAIQAFPKVKEIVTEAKDFFTGLTGKVITVEQQKQLHDHIDELSAAAQAGKIAPAWTVEADPE